MGAAAIALGPGEHHVGGTDLKARRDKPWWDWDSSSKEVCCPAEVGATELDGALQGWAQTLRKGCFPIGVGRVCEYQDKGR